MGCDFKFIETASILESFNPRTRMGCDRKPSEIDIREGSFNPRTRMGCDIDDESEISEAKVSIHAPAWGATFDTPGVDVGETVSIHAPAWGATVQAFSQQRVY